MSVILVAASGGPAIARVMCLLKARTVCSQLEIMVAASKREDATTFSALHLFVVLDVFSWYDVGWMLAPRESATLAERLIATCCRREGITRGRLTWYADRGAAMTSTTVALRLAELGVTKTRSRAQVSNDNPYSEARFKTLKYRPTFPTRFGSMEDTRAYCTAFLIWYNTIHRHTRLVLHTPCDMHHSRADARRAQRAVVLTAANHATRHRFVDQRVVATYLAPVHR